MTTTHHAILALSWVILGACAGSFLNVCVHRVPRGMSVLRPRSRCPRCGSSIRSRDNIPILGWLLLGGRCRDCRAPISARYPAVELGLGILFALPYIAVVTLSPGDPWDRIGASGLITILLTSWTAAFVGSFAVLAGADARRPLTPHRAAEGCEAPASSVLPTSAERG